MTVLNTENWLVGLFVLRNLDVGGGGDKVLERNAGLGMKVNPITSADVCGNVFLH